MLTDKLTVYILYIECIYSIYTVLLLGGDAVDIVISNSSVEPIYEQIVKQFKKMILTQTLCKGEQLPSIRSLARELQISVITTKRAYEELEKEGFIETVGGKGTFVAGHNREFLTEKKRNMLEEILSSAVKDAKILGINRQEFKELVDVLFEEDDKA